LVSKSDLRKWIRGINQKEGHTLIIETFEFDKKVNTGLTVYLHEDKPEFSRIEKRPFVLVIPGGGYSFCSEREAEPVALNFVAAGYHAGVLRYHVGEHRDFDKSLVDAELAMKKIKELAFEWKVNSEKIAVIGFSAGGHLAAALSNLSQEKPSLCVLGYPTILESFSEVMQIKAPSLDKCVTSKTPATFLFSTFEDNVVPIENSLLYLRALEENEVPFESHIFQKGLHGLSLATKWFGNREEMIDPRFSKWFDLCVEWMDTNWEKKVLKVESKVDIWDLPIKEIWAIKSNRELLLEAFPQWRDRSRYKIVKNLSFNQLSEIASDKFSKDQIRPLIDRLTC